MKRTLVLQMYPHQGWVSFGWQLCHWCTLKAGLILLFDHYVTHLWCVRTGLMTGLKQTLIYLWFQTLCQCTSSYNCRFPYGFDSTCCLLTNDGSAPLQIPKVIVTEKVGSSIGISHCRFSQNPNFPATSIVSNFKSWNIKDREQDDNICFQTCKQLRRPIFQNMSFFVGFAKWQKVSLTYFPLCLKILKNVSYHDELIDLTIFSWTCRNGQVKVVKGDFFVIFTHCAFCQM